jgi:glycosyltransferase involved in cell wall biosynthesis
MASVTPITVISHTCNSASTLQRMLDSVAWADELLIADMESSDRTCAVAEAAHARIIKLPRHPRVDAVRAAVLVEAKHEWIFVIDSDEYLAADAKASIDAMIAEYGQTYDAFAIPRFNWFGDHLMKGSGWYPDHQVRLFRKGAVTWTDSTHQGPTLTVPDQRLRRIEPPACFHIHHMNYIDLGHVISKQAEYARNDIYSDNISDFDFEKYLVDAFLEYRRRLDRERDGDYSVALATIMAWDKIMRGLIHWDRLGRKTELPDIFSLPVVLGQQPDRPLALRLRRIFSKFMRQTFR